MRVSLSVIHVYLLMTTIVHSSRFFETSDGLRLLLAAFR